MKDFANEEIPYLKNMFEEAGKYTDRLGYGIVVSCLGTAGIAYEFSDNLNHPLLAGL